VRGLQSGDTRMWLGIPYAQAGRFQAPTAPPAWQGIMRMVSHGDICPQGETYGFRAPAVVQSEVCLNLNVYAPTNVPQHLVNGKLEDKVMPVVVFIDAAAGGGGASSISAQAVAAGLGLEPKRAAAGVVIANGMAADGHKLASQLSSIVVTLNFRVGPLGFFSSQAFDQLDGWAGNYGLLDQVAALRWVRQNIANFGGDPASITLLGTGAAASLSLVHVSLSSSAGLFKRVVALGNTVSRSETIQSKAQVNQAGMEFQAAVGCTATDTAALRECMLGASTATIIETGYGTNWTQTWGPSMDGVFLRTQDAAEVFRSPVVLQASSSALMLGAPSAQADLSLNFALNAATADNSASSQKLLTEAQVMSILQARFVAWPGVANNVSTHYRALPSSLLPALTAAESRTNVQWLAKVLSDGTVTCRHSALAQAAYTTSSSAPARGSNGAATPAFLLDFIFRLNNAPGGYGSHGVAGTARSLLVQDGCWETCAWSQEAEDASEATASGVLRQGLGAFMAGEGDTAQAISASQVFTTGDKQSLQWDAWAPSTKQRLDLNLPQSAVVSVGSAADDAQCAFWASTNFQ